ncbi:MAG: toxic anion resistance protein [Clostridiales bacterium]|nr:toxic anion resistance protein [Clostridiales bacterium]
MTETNQTNVTPETQQAYATAPVLTLQPVSAGGSQQVLDEASAAIESAMNAAPRAEAEAAAAAQAAAEAVKAVKDMDNAMLTEEDKRNIQEFVKKIDVNNTDHVLLYGADAQKKIADFSESALATVRTNDTGEVGNMLVNLVNEIKGFGEAAEKPKGLGGLFWNAKKAISDMQTKYQKVDANVDVIATQLENHQVQLLKDVSMFNHLYDMNTQYFKELTMYIIAGEQKLQEVRSGDLTALKAAAEKSGDAMDAQRANDLAANCDRFEKKLHDLKLTRQVALQMAPQIRLLQNNDSLLVERIQSTLSNTLPLWKSQILIALGMHRSQEALKAQTAVTDMTNELLQKNAEALKVGTIETAREAERGIIDLETLKQTNQSLMDTINEVMRIQEEGRAKRLTAEQELATMEVSLKKKLLEVHT